jgi:hypothetical protein
LFEVEFAIQRFALGLAPRIRSLLAESPPMRARRVALFRYFTVGVHVGERDDDGSAC